MTDREYVYRVESVEKVTDGDTFWLHLDVGFRQTQLTHIRLAGFDCPERNSGSAYEKERARDATEMAFIVLTGWPIWVRTEKDPDNFGRWLGHIWAERLDGDVLLGDTLRQSNLASVWPTRWRDEFDQGGRP